MRIWNVDTISFEYKNNITNMKMGLKVYYMDGEMLRGNIGHDMIRP